MLTRVFLFTLLVMVSGCASTPKGAEYKAGSVQALPGQAVIIVYRDKEVIGSGLKWAVTDGARDPATIDPGVYFPFNVKPGRVELLARPQQGFNYMPANAALLVLSEAYRKVANDNAEPKPVVAIDVKEGETYYLKTSIERGSMYPAVVQVDAATAEAELKDKRLPQ